VVQERVLSPSVLDGVSQLSALKEGQNSGLDPIITFDSSPTIPTHLPTAFASPPLNPLITTRQPDSSLFSSARTLFINLTAWPQRTYGGNKRPQSGS
jgi:hypothetical protein